MASNAIAAGDVLMVALPSHTPPGHEQEGLRPVVVVGVPPEPLRYPVVYVVPLTSQAGGWAARNPTIYPAVPVGAGGLTLPSIALLDRARALDIGRVRRFLGTLSPEQYESLGQGLKSALAVPR